MVTIPPPHGARPREPWFRQHPRIALVLAGVLFLVILALRLVVDDSSDPYTVFYVFPVALLAMTFGLRGGVGGGLVAVALVAGWVVVLDVAMTPVGWLSRTAPVLLLGVLLGDAVDRARRAEAERLRFEAAALLQREAIEVNDSIVQGMAAAKWSFESGDATTGLRSLDQTINHAQTLVSRLIKQADLGHQVNGTSGRSSPSSTNNRL